MSPDTSYDIRRVWRHIFSNKVYLIKPKIDVLNKPVKLSSFFVSFHEQSNALLLTNKYLTFFVSNENSQ